jgi:hypothetical protein
MHSIRTLAAIPIEIPILEVGPQPAYQRVARKVKRLRDLGMSRAAIARRLGVCRKTVAKAVSFLRSVHQA